MVDINDCSGGGAGFGGGPWGGMPFGGADQQICSEFCDLLLFNSSNMGGILTAPPITVVGDPAQYVFDFINTSDIGILSGDVFDNTFPTSDAYLLANVPVHDDYTLELNLTFDNLPNDFTDVPNRHFMFAVTDTTGPCAAIFLSKVGIAYSGSAHFVPSAPASGTLVLNGPLQIIPVTSGYVPLNIEMTYRVAVSASTGAVYVYATQTADLPIIGQHLVAVLPVINAGELSPAPFFNGAFISARGTTVQPARVSLTRWCLSSLFDIPNTIPVANAGQDQAVRACSIALLDGSASFDPEGAHITYHWRLIDAPPTSVFVIDGVDGKTFASFPFDGFTDRFYSASLQAINLTDPILNGSVLLVGGVPRTILGRSTDLHGFYLQLEAADVPSNLTNATFRIIRQNGLSDYGPAKPSFFADVPGFYKFDLTVFDGSLYSEPSTVILNVLESSLPRGCIPNTDFLFNYLSDFWKLVEGTEVFSTLWSGLAQVAATELYTLWQYEYSKSLRDIQKTIVRRWLHYDLVLAEPLPELTKVRALWSGVQSLPIPVVGDPGVNGTTLVIYSSLFSSEQTVTWTSSSTASEAASELASLLSAIDTRFSVYSIPDRAGSNLVLRIDAPFPFLVFYSSTTTVFNLGDSNGPVVGTGSSGPGTRTYVVDRNLAGLGIQEDDLLILDGIGYRIANITDGPMASSDTYDQQRIVLKDDLPVPASTSWLISSTVKSQLLDFYNGLVSKNDNVFFEVVGADSVDLVATRATGICPALPGTLGIDTTPLGLALTPGSGKTVYLAKCVRNTYLPISPLIKDIPALQEHIVTTDEQTVLRRNVDYYLETYRGAAAIRFADFAIWQHVAPPDRLWAEYSYIDNNPVIEANFGIPAGFTLDALAQLPNTVDYLSAVSGIWYAFFNGPKPENIRVGSQIFLGLPFAEESGTVEEIRSDFSSNTARILIRDAVNTEIVRSYTYPKVLSLEVNSDTGQPYVVGDSVTQFAPLVEGVEVIDYLKDKNWFKHLLNQGVFSEVQKYHTFTIRVDSRVFNLSSILLLRNFVLTFKPTYTYPVLVVEQQPKDLDIEIVDRVAYSAKLVLFDGFCQSLGSTLFDDARPSADPEAFWNQFDSNESGLDPTYPTPERVPWGYDKGYLCPEDRLFMDLLYTQGTGPILFDTFAVFDSSIIQGMEFEATSPIVIPAVPGAYTVPDITVHDANFDGTITIVRLIITGRGPGSYGTDYEFVVAINGTDTIVQAFDASASSLEVEINPGQAVLSGDTITFKIRIPGASSDPGPRSPNWSFISALVTVEDSTWTFDEIVPAGTYFIRISL